MNDQITSGGHELVSLLDKALDGGNCEEALCLVDDSKYSQYFDDGSGWDLIPVVCKYISQKRLDKFPEVVHCCEVLVVNIAKKAHPEESLLELIELVECPENNILFFALMSPMQICLQRKIQRGNFLQFCLNSIEYHITNQTVPSIDEENGDDGLTVVESDSAYKKLTELYLASHTFYEPFLSDILFKLNTFESSGNGLEQIQNERKGLICFIMQLFGKPFASFTLVNTNPTASARTIAELLMFDLKRLCNNLLIFLEYAEIRDSHEHRKKGQPMHVDESCGDAFLFENKVPTLSIGVLYYLIYGEEIMLNEVPCVYNTLYVLQIILYLSTKMLQESNNCIVAKGLTLAEKVLSRVEVLKIPFKMLELPTVEDFVKAVTFTIVYNPSSKIRQFALKVLKIFIFKFEQQGRYVLMCNMHSSITHSGLLGCLITELKEMINCAIAVHPTPTPFCGKKLFTLLKLYCALPDVAIKDILDFSSQITASLNLLRFVIIRDKQNVTGIWDYLDHFEEKLFEPLRKTIDLTRESINVELKNLSERTIHPVPSLEVTEKSNINMRVTVSGKEISAPNIDDESMAQQFHNTLNVLDMMASLLFRLKECIQLGSQQRKLL